MTQDANETFWVDIPTEDCINNPNGAFKNVAVFTSRAEAITYAMEHFGADDQGRVSLVIP